MRRGIRGSVALGLSLVLLLLGGPTPVVHADTLYVDGACEDSDVDGLCDDGITYKTIQAAIDAAGLGDIITVEAGVYEEQLEISQNLTLIGAGPCTTVRSPASVSPCFTTGENDFRAVICVQDAESVIIQDMVVDGAGLGNDNHYFVGVAYHNAGGSVQDVTISNVRDTPWSSVAHGVGLYANNSTGASRSLAVTGCSIYGFQKNAMVLGGANLQVDVSGCTATGRGPIDTVAQNGIVVGWGATGAVGPGNTVSNVSYSPGTLVASGVLVMFSDVDVLSNTVSGAQVGIYYWESSGSISENLITSSVVDVGSSVYWGMIGTDGGVSDGRELGATNPPNELDGVFDNSEMRMGTGATDSRTVAAATLNILENQLVGGSDSGSPVGIEADIRCGAGDLVLTGLGNQIADWGYGVVLNRCTSGGSGSADITLNQNMISGNSTYGVYVTGLASNIDAQRNWWGHDTGPLDDSDDRGTGGFYNPSGQGDAVTDNADYSFWLQRQAYLPLVSRNSLGVSSSPDLRIEVLTVGPSPVVAGQPVTIGIQVQNVGTVPAGPFWVDLYDNPAPPPTQANQVWNYLCDGPLEDCYGIAWYVQGGLLPGQSVLLTSVDGFEADQTHWIGSFVNRGRHDLYAFADSWNDGVWYGAVLEDNEGLSNRYGPVTVCVLQGAGGEQFQARDSLAPIPFRPAHP